MNIKEFMELVDQGFDVSFNYNDVFYTISLIYEDEKTKKFGIGGDDGLDIDFDTFESIPNFVLQGKTIKEIIENTSEEEIFY
ncbi:MAG TPA: hypothetical protein DDW20_04085 [Firmicutes bacterium]|nr:hypothetical protein [Bacillota bacterium]